MARPLIPYSDPPADQAPRSVVIRCVTGVSTRQVHARSITGPRQVHNRLSNRREPGADVRTRLTGDVSIACL